MRPDEAENREVPSSSASGDEPRWQERLQGHRLLLLLVRDPLTAVAFFLIAGLTAVLLGSLWKVWDPIPEKPGRFPSISLLDGLQAAACRRSAREAERSGHWDQALLSWLGALGQNSADIEGLRGLLGYLTRCPSVRTSHLKLGLVHGRALLEATDTNRADAVLLADVLERHRLPEAALDLLRAVQQGDFTARESVVHARALLSSGREAAFAQRRLAPGFPPPGDPVLDLYVATADALGPPEVSGPAMASLRRALRESPCRVEAARMLCVAAYARRDPSAFQEGLLVLRELDSAMVHDDALWWDLLDQHGRRGEAVELARAYDRVPPPTPAELLALIRSWIHLGLEDRALAMMDRHVEEYGLVPEVWVAYFDLLIRRRSWSAIRRHRTRILLRASTRDPVFPVALWADAMADLGEHRAASARQTLRRLVEESQPGPLLAMRIAASLLQAGEADTAEGLLRRNEARLDSLPEYWQQVVVSARGRGDMAALRQASRRLVELRPRDPQCIALHVAVRLALREAPSEALADSLRLMQFTALPTAGQRINHAAALVQNHRPLEALEALDRLDTKSLLPAERAAWLMARAEALARSGHPREALECGRQADLAHALPPEAEWFQGLLEECRRLLEPRP